MKRSSLIFLVVSSLAGSLLAQPADQRLIVIVEGTAAGVPAMVPDINGDGTPDPAMCWDVNLVDAKTNRVIGTSRDCLSFANLDGTGDKPFTTTYFHFPQGTLVAHGKTTGQPVLWDPSINPDVDPNVTLVTGTFPAPGVNNIVSGTGRFAGARGRVRLSGAAKPDPDGVRVTFSCIFIIDLYGPRE